MGRRNQFVNMNGGGISTRHELISTFARKHDVAYDDAKHILQEKPMKMTPPHKEAALIEDVISEYGSLANFRKALTTTCEI